MEEKIRKAVEIARDDLRSCYAADGIIAGQKRFDDYWARDSFFASLGSISLNDFEIAKNNFALFLLYQKPDGQLPRRLDRHYVLLKYLGFKIKRPKLKVKYRTAFGKWPATDPNSLFIYAVNYYLKISDDKKFVEENFDKIKKAMDWNFSLDIDNDGLLEEGFLANWEDTIFKAGKIIYTNVLHYLALKSFAEILSALGRDADFYEKKAEWSKIQIEKYLWNGGHFIGWIGRQVHNVFIADGNLLAIISGLVESQKADSILAKIGEFNQESDLIKNIDFKYGLWRHSPVRIIGLATGYHEKFEWLWLNCILALAKNTIGDKKGALFELNKMAEIIIKHNHVYEIYKGNVPVKSRFFVSEVPFAWSAGLYIYAETLINHNLVDKN
ncbi:MAG: GH116 family glycosyl hydrolase [Patescibacteria group bacterium]|nr:GH116 family glycosyl hydrolase [Patescibacteria group bacterium]